MTLFEAIILGIVEGITEFLPISSTGHMIIASSLMGIAEDSFTKTFTVSIQFGAILSVIFLYWKRFFQSMDFYYKLFVAFIPAAVFGKLLNDFIDSLLGNVAVVAYMLLAGGVFLIFMDHLIKQKTEETDDPISYKTAFKIGLFQVIAMIPGVSRSAATIIGGLTLGLTRKTAAEFSFFLAVPTMFAATVYKLYEFYQSGVQIEQHQITLLVVGNIVAFVVAVLAIKSFIGVVTKYGLKVYGYYRIVIGVLIIVLMVLGVDLKIVD
ncbi:MAG: undecaprenyl-diphosphate phosphatase [Bacteroidetes bacterium]|nr:undecaprenyl-diphosphate phosphatase [Bacteroidota bacterium]